MLNEKVRRRAMRVDLAETRAVLKIVKPVNRHLTDWQVNAVRLAALAEKLKVRGRRSAQYLCEAEELRSEVLKQKRILHADVEELPPALARCNRFADTSRALDGVCSNLEKAIALLQSTKS